MSNRRQRRKERARRNEERRRQEAITAMLSRPPDDQILGPTNPRILGGVDAVRENVPGADFLLGGVLDALEEVGWYGEASPLSIGFGALDILDPTPILGAALVPFKKTAKKQLADKLKADKGYGNLFSPEEIDQLVDNFEESGYGSPNVPDYELFNQFGQWYGEGMPKGIEETFPSLPKEKIGSEVFLGPLGLPPDSPYGTGWGSPNDLKAKKEAAKLQEQEAADIVAAMSPGNQKLKPVEPDDPENLDDVLSALAAEFPEDIQKAAKKILQGEEGLPTSYPYGLDLSYGPESAVDVMNDLENLKTEDPDQFNQIMAATGFPQAETGEMKFPGLENLASNVDAFDVAEQQVNEASYLKSMFEDDYIMQLIHNAGISPTDFDQNVGDFIDDVVGEKLTYNIADDLDEHEIANLFTNWFNDDSAEGILGSQSMEQLVAVPEHMVDVVIDGEEVLMPMKEVLESNLIDDVVAGDQEKFADWVNATTGSSVGDDLSEFQTPKPGDAKWASGKPVTLGDFDFGPETLPSDSPGSFGPSFPPSDGPPIPYVNFDPGNPVEDMKENLFNNYYMGLEGIDGPHMTAFEKDFNGLWETMSPDHQYKLIHSNPQSQLNMFEAYVTGAAAPIDIKSALEKGKSDIPLIDQVLDEFGFGKTDTPLIDQILDEHGFNKTPTEAAAPLPITDPANAAVLEAKYNVMKNNAPLFGYDSGLEGMAKSNDDWKQFVQDMTNDGTNPAKLQEFMNMNPAAQSNLFTDWMNESVGSGQQHFFGSYANQGEPGGFPTIGQGPVEEIELEEVKEPGTYFSPLENLPFFRGKSPAMQEAEWIYDEAERQGLDTSAAARLNRAMEQGFSPEIYIHRTKANEDFSEFDPNRESRGGSYFAMSDPGAGAGSQGGPASPRNIPVRVQGPIFGREEAPEWLLPKRISKADWEETAEGYNPANKLDRIPEEFQDFAGEISDLFPVISQNMYEQDPFSGDYFLRPLAKRGGMVPGTNQPAQRFRSPDWSWIENKPEVQELIKAMGYGSWQVADEGLTATGLPSIAVSDPSMIRSTQAMFNPKWKDSGNIMRGLIPPAAAIPILSGYEEDPEEDFFP